MQYSCLKNDYKYSSSIVIFNKKSNQFIKKMSIEKTVEDLVNERVEEIEIKLYKEFVKSLDESLHRTDCITKQHEKISQLAKNCPQLNAKNPQDCIREPNFGIHKFTELINIKQTGTVGEFIDNFNVCLNSQSHSLSSEQEVALFLNGLKYIRKYVSQRK